MGPYKQKNNKIIFDNFCFKLEAQEQRLKLRPKDPIFKEFESVSIDTHVDTTQSSLAQSNSQFLCHQFCCESKFVSNEHNGDVDEYDG